MAYAPLSQQSSIDEIFDKLQKMFGVNIIIPQNAAYGTVIGAALEGTKNG